VGLELLSGGTKEAVFVDQLKTAISCIRLNLGESQIKNQQEFAKRVTHVVFAEVGAFLSQPGLLGVNRAPNLIFMDPPYGQGFVAKTLDQLGRCPLLVSKPIKSPLFILIEHVSDEPITPQASSLFELVTQEAYGPKSLTLLKIRSL
jgi:16S rRNA G966 N2-methylase RsmD